MYHRKRGIFILKYLNTGLRPPGRLNNAMWPCMEYFNNPCPPQLATSKRSYNDVESHYNNFFTIYRFFHHGRNGEDVHFTTYLTCQTARWLINE